MDNLFKAAEFTKAAEIFDSIAGASPPYATVLQRSRIFVKREFADAIRFLIDRPAPKGNAKDGAERQMILGMAYARIGEHEIAREHLWAAEKAAKIAKHADLQLEIAYWVARGKVMAGDLEGAESDLVHLAKSASHAARVRFLDVQSLIQGRQQIYHEQSKTLLTLVEVIASGREDMPEFRVWATHTLAVLTREIPIPTARAVISAELMKPWPEYFRENRFQTEKALAWICALSGDYFNAFRYLKAATATAPTAAWKMMALLDRAYLAKCTGELLWSRQELAEAEEISAQIDWARTQGEERIALLLFSELFAGIDRGKAAFYLAKFAKFGSVSDPLLNFAARDERLQAMAEYVHGVVDIELGHRKAGLQSLRSSFATFDRIGFNWRAARSAMQIYRATHDRTMLNSAREKIAPYMSSWLGQEVVERAKEGMGLTPMQEKIFRALCNGQSTSEIARHLGRSEFTVRNHLKLVFTAFGVRSRTALLAEASRRGLMR